MDDEDEEKMITVEWWISTGLVGAKHKGTWEVEEYVTDEELDGMLQDEMANHIDCGWTRS